MRAAESGAQYPSKAIAKWRKRATVEDMKAEPSGSRSTVLSEGAMVVAFRRHALLLLDDCLYAVQPSLYHLGCIKVRAALNRRRSFSIVLPGSACSVVTLCGRTTLAASIVVGSAAGGPLTFRYG